MAKWHQKKEVSDAIEYALARGWRLEKGGGHSHNWGTIYCPEASREGHHFFIRSTPRNPGNHARRIRDAVDGCPHSTPIDENDAGAEVSP